MDFKAFWGANKELLWWSLLIYLMNFFFKKGGLDSVVWRGELASVERSLVSAITAFGGARTQTLYPLRLKLHLPACNVQTDEQPAHPQWGESRASSAGDPFSETLGEKPFSAVVKNLHFWWKAWRKKAFLWAQLSTPETSVWHPEQKGFYQNFFFSSQS